MKHPEILLLPLLMFADYFLTVLGSIEREKRHALHFKIEDYELNPLWQKAIRERKWFNLRHTLIVIAATSVLMWAPESGNMPEEFAQVMLGALLVLLSMIVGKHISNILTFRYLVKRPDRASGQVTMSHQLVLRISMYQTLIVLLPILLIAILSRSDYAVGGVFGVTLFICVHLGWIRKANRRDRQRGV